MFICTVQYFFVNVNMSNIIISCTMKNNVSEIHLQPQIDLPHNRESLSSNGILLCLPISWSASKLWLVVLKRARSVLNLLGIGQERYNSSCLTSLYLHGTTLILACHTPDFDHLWNSQSLTLSENMLTKAIPHLEHSDFPIPSQNHNYLGIIYPLVYLPSFFPLTLSAIECITWS